MPFPEPTCINGTICPISQRKHKKDISYLTDDDRQRLNDELLGFRLATYRYKSESASERDVAFDRGEASVSLSLRFGLNYVNLWRLAAPSRAIDPSSTLIIDKIGIRLDAEEP